MVKIRLKESRAFRTTVDGEDIKVGYESVEVEDKTAKYLLDNFPYALEKAPEEPKEEN